MDDKNDVGRRIAHHQDARATHQRAAAMHRYAARQADIAGDDARATSERALADEQDAAAAAEHDRSIAASRSSQPQSPPGRD